MSEHIPQNRIDDLFSAALSRPRFFADGWGDRRLIDELMERFERRIASRQAMPEDIEMRWTDRSEYDDHVVQRAFFETPARDLPIPPQARASYVEMLLPRWRAGEPPPPVYLHLAATGDHGFARRRRLAKPLVEKGIGAVILENPFYGLRRPPRQIMSALRRASDQLLMNYLTIEEARALLGWFHRRGFRHLGVTGYSMGGYMAAYIASLSPVPVTPVPCAAGNSPAAPYLQSSMSRIFAWSALGEALEGGAGEAREHFEELIAAFTVDALPQPERVDRAIIIASKDDAIVPPQEAVALHEHWDGSKIRWLPGGHMTSYMLARESMRRAMYDAMHDTMYR